MMFRISLSHKKVRAQAPLLPPFHRLLLPKPGKPLQLGRGLQSRLLIGCRLARSPAGCPRPTLPREVRPGPPALRPPEPGNEVRGAQPAPPRPTGGFPGERAVLPASARPGPGVGTCTGPGARGADGEGRLYTRLGEGWVGRGLGVGSSGRS